MLKAPKGSAKPLFDRLSGLGLLNVFVRRLLSFLPAVIVEIKGLRMLLSPKRNPTLFFYPVLGYEDTETALFEDCAREGFVVADLGAGIGYYSLIAARRVGGNGRVYAFEPDPASFLYLRKNAELNRFQNIVLERQAVLDRPAAAELFLHKFHPGANSLFGNGGSPIQVKAVNLDAYFQDKGFRVDVLKMDIEGAEALALKGAERILGKNRRIKIFFEFAPLLISRSGSSAGDCLSALSQQGFYIYEIMEKRGKGGPLRRVDASGFNNFIKRVDVSGRRGVTGARSMNIFCCREERADAG
jgi:FkbM family methyltransferase